MAYNIIATICYLSDFPTTRVQYRHYADRLQCLCSMVRFCFSAVAMFSRLQEAAATVPPLINASNVSHHVRQCGNILVHSYGS